MCPHQQRKSLQLIELQGFMFFLSSGDPIHTLQTTIFLSKSNFFTKISILYWNKSQETPETSGFMEELSLLINFLKTKT